MDPITILSAIPGIGPFLPWIIFAGTVAAALGTVLPHPTGTTGWYPKLYAVIAWLGLNIGKARNFPAVTPATISATGA